MYDVCEEEILDSIKNIDNAIKRFNESGRQVEMSYSWGYELSTNYTECNLNTLLRKADSNMYKNKSKYHQNVKELHLEDRL